MACRIVHGCHAKVMAGMLPIPVISAKLSLPWATAYSRSLAVLAFPVNGKVQSFGPSFALFAARSKACFAAIFAIVSSSCRSASSLVFA